MYLWSTSLDISSEMWRTCFYFHALFYKLLSFFFPSLSPMFSDWKRSSQDMKQCPYEMLVLQAVVLPVISRHWTLLFFFKDADANMSSWN